MLRLLIRIQRESPAFSHVPPQPPNRKRNRTLPIRKQHNEIVCPQSSCLLVPGEMERFLHPPPWLSSYGSTFGVSPGWGSTKLGGKTEEGCPEASGRLAIGLRTETTTTQRRSPSGLGAYLWKENQQSLGSYDHALGTLPGNHTIIGPILQIGRLRPRKLA